ncbi:toxin VasX [Achromobacter insolitus]|uniref:toxin VasX n=1 Tax=Achromobacter insolitus TaxID=217204 RepID=UPI001749AB5E|nr:toxin VasX [Achromobacter insolitus]
MTQPYKKALGPDRPNEKQLGKAISPPACQRCVPIYPLRYGVAERSWEEGVFPTLSTDGYPELAAGKAYGLRVLRPGAYVYLCYFQHGRMWTQHYQVTDDLRFARIWWTREDDQDDIPGRLARPEIASARPYLSAPESKTADVVYLLTSETMLTHARLWNIENDVDGIRTRLATTIRPSGGVEQAHAFNIALLAHATPELRRPGSNERPGYTWSEISLPESFTTYDTVIPGAHVELVPIKDIVPLAVVLHDPIGVVSELAHLVAVAAADRQVYEIDNNHAYTSATVIKQYLQSVQERATPQAYAKRRDLVRFDQNSNADVLFGNAVPYMLAYEEAVKRKQSAIDTLVNDLESWIKTGGSAIADDWQDGWFSKVLSCFDLGAKENAQDYERVVAHCIGNLTHSESGRSTYRKMLLAQPEKSPVWLALGHGIRELHGSFANPPLLKNVLDIGVAAFAPIFQFNVSYPATKSSDVLVNQMLSQLGDMSLPDATADRIVRRLRLFAEVRVGSTIVTYRVSSAEARFQYAQFHGEQHMNTERLRKWGITVKRPLRNQAATVLLYEEVRVGDQVKRISSAPSTANNRQPFQLEGNVFSRMLEQTRQSRAYGAAQAGIVRAEYGFTGLAAVSAIMALRSSIRDLVNGKDDRSLVGMVNGVSALAAVAAVISSGLLVKGDLIQLHALAKGKSLALARLAAFEVRRLATMYGAGAAGLGAVADGIRAAIAFTTQQNFEAGRMYLASAGCGVLATAGLALSASGTVLGIIGPVGWVVLAFIATVGVIYFSIQAAFAKFQPDEVWLAHCYWSRGDRAYRYKSMDQELAAFHGAVYGVRVVASWETPSMSARDIIIRSIPVYGLWQDGADLKRAAAKEGIGTLSLSVVLPAYPTLNEGPPLISHDDVFQYTLNARRHGQSLNIVRGPIATGPGYRFPYDTECMVVGKDYIRDGTRHVSWLITMRADTEIMLDYCYRPDIVNEPGLAMFPQQEPLVFTHGTWLTDPIDEALLAPVQEPK